MTTQGAEARRGETVGLDAKRDGPFGAADAPQPTDNAETIMTDVQQSVPVAQIDREAAADLFCIVFPTDKSIGNALRRPNGDGPWTQAFARHRLASLPCKSGEGAGEIGDFVMVPRKLTDDMLEAVVKLDFTSTHDPLWPEYWAAMLDAAPTVPDATQTREAEAAHIREIAEAIYAEVADEPLGDLTQRRQAVQDTWHDAVRAALSARDAA